MTPYSAALAVLALHSEYRRAEALGAAPELLEDLQAAIREISRFAEAGRAEMSRSPVQLTR